MYVINPGQIAASLERRAEQAALDVEHCEHLAASLPDCAGIRRDLELMRQDAVSLAVAYAYFKELAERPETPVEFTIRHRLPAAGQAVSPGVPEPHQEGLAAPGTAAAES